MRVVLTFAFFAAVAMSCTKTEGELKSRVGQVRDAPKGTEETSNTKETITISKKEAATEITPADPLDGEEALVTIVGTIENQASGLNLTSVPILWAQATALRADGLELVSKTFQKTQVDSYGSFSLQVPKDAYISIEVFEEDSASNRLGVVIPVIPLDHQGPINVWVDLVSTKARQLFLTTQGESLGRELISAKKYSIEGLYGLAHSLLSAEEKSGTPLSSAAVSEMLKRHLAAVAVDDSFSLLKDLKFFTSVTRRLAGDTLSEPLSTDKAEAKPSTATDSLDVSATQASALPKPIILAARLDKESGLLHVAFDKLSSAVEASYEIRIESEEESFYVNPTNLEFDAAGSTFKLDSEDTYQILNTESLVLYAIPAPSPLLDIGEGNVVISVRQGDETASATTSLVITNLEIQEEQAPESSAQQVAETSNVEQMAEEIETIESIQADLKTDMRRIAKATASDVRLSKLAAELEKVEAKLTKKIGKLRKKIKQEQDRLAREEKRTKKLADKLARQETRAAEKLVRKEDKAAEKLTQQQAKADEKAAKKAAKAAEKLAQQQAKADEKAAEKAAKTAKDLARQADADAEKLAKQQAKEEAKRLKEEAKAKQKAESEAAKRAKQENKGEDS